MNWKLKHRCHRLAAGKILALAALTFAVWASSHAPASAQEQVPAVVGVVDLQQILRESVAAQGVRGEIEAKQTQYRNEISGKENVLREKQDELQRKRTLLSPEAYAEQEAAFAKEVESLQREVAERNRQLEENLAYGMQQVQSAALEIIARIADQRSYNLVMDKSQVLLVSKEFEFSVDVIAELNASLPAVSTTPPPAPTE